MIFLESVSEKVLSDLVLGNINIDFDFLALKIMLSRLRQRVKMEPSPTTIQGCVNELQSFFVKFGHLPKTQQDMEKIFRSRSVS
jgi:hypothetical protein